MWPVALRRISWLLTVTSWNVAPFSLRKNVSGTQTFLRSSSPKRTCTVSKQHKLRMWLRWYSRKLRKRRRRTRLASISSHVSLMRKTKQYSKCCRETARCNVLAHKRATINLAKSRRIRINYPCALYIKYLSYFLPWPRMSWNHLEMTFKFTRREYVFIVVWLCERRKCGTESEKKYQVTGTLYKNIYCKYKHLA